jgi:flagellar hook-associated protein 2
MISAGGLITGIDSGALIQQLMQLERAPILRYQERIANLEAQQTAARELRTTLTTLRNSAQDFRFSSIFDAYKSTSSNESVLTAQVSSSSPLSGAFDIDVTQLATSTVATGSAAVGATISDTSALDSSGITTAIEAGTFEINGVEFTVDPTTDSLDDILSTINASAAGVTGTFNSGTNTVTFENSAASDTSLINFGTSDGDGVSNFLEVLSVTGATQSTGSGGSTEVISTRSLGAIDPQEVVNTQSFAVGAITSGTFSINGIEISVDHTVDNMQDIMERISSSDAQVLASYDSTTDTIRVESQVLGSRTVRFGGTGDTSNFLSVMALDTAVQAAGQDTLFSINGGAELTRNSTEVSDAISGVTLSLLSVGTSTVTVSSDDDTIVEDVQEFITEFNTAVTAIKDATQVEGTLAGDGGIRAIETYLRSSIFSQVADLGGSFESLLDIGISTGQDFDSTTPSMLELDEDAFREALRDNRSNVEGLFSNDDETGIADIIYTYIDGVTGATGFLHNRSKANGTIDKQIQSVNDQIDRVEGRLLLKEERLRRQFTRLETMSSSLQGQGSALGALSFGSF